MNLNLLTRVRGEFFPEPDAFDKIRGVKTSGLKSLIFRRLFVGRDCRRYQAIDEDRFKDAVQDVPRWTFIDIGSGRAKPLILAHESGFPKVIGVELSPSLCCDARRNLRKLGIAGQIICGDATQFVFPKEPSVVMFNNPLGPQLMQQVLANLGDSVPRILIYVMPLHEELFERFRVLRRGEMFRVYATSVFD